MCGPCLEAVGFTPTFIEKGLMKTPLEDGKPVGGNGRLTENRIDKLQVAIWHHSKSSNDNPDHGLCPEGENSWCGFQRDIAKETTDYVHKDPIPEAVANVILPTFEALSEESLLSKCMHGGTQNQNESINGLIWQRATKETHASLPTVETATFLGVAHFNDGSMSLLSVIKQLGILPGVHCMKACRKLDSDQIHHPHRKSGEAAKKRRKQLRKWKKGHNDS